MILTAGGVLVPSYGIARPPVFNPGVVRNRGAAAAGGGGVLAFDAATNATPVVTAASITFSHTCTGSDLILVVSVGWASTAISVTGVTYNGVAMSDLGQIGDTAGATECGLFILGGPATGAHDVVVSFSGATDGGACAQSWTGGDTSSPNRVAVTAQDSGAPANTTVTVANAQNGDVCVDATSVSAAAHAVGADQTSRGETDNLAGNGFSIGGSSEPATGSTVMSWTHAGSFWAIIACALKPKP